MDKKLLINSFNTELKMAGFQKKSTTWYLDEGGIIKVVNLQKSNYGDLYYVNVSIFLKELDNDQFPSENECHIRTRMDNSMVDAPKDYDYLFDLENVKLSVENYQKEIKDCIQQNIIPQLDLIKSREGLLKVAQINPIMLNMIPLKVKEYFNI
jgi:hypothetical protein